MSIKVFKSLGDESFNRDLIKNNSRVLVKVGHDGCPPCVNMSRYIQSYDTEYILLDLDVGISNKYIPLAQGSFPKWVVVHDGEVVLQQSGFSTSMMPVLPDLIKSSKNFEGKASALAKYVTDLLSENEG